MDTILLTIAASLGALACGSLFSRDHSHNRRREQSDMSVDTSSLPAAFLEFLQSHSDDGSGEAIAVRFSQLLRDNLGCERLVFLHRHHDQLELSHFHGCRSVEAELCRMPVTAELTRFALESSLPRALAELEPLLPELVFESMSEAQCDTCIPVAWRNRLHGLYFVRFAPHPRPAEFLPLLASLARTVSATCHLEALEDQYADLQHRVGRLEQRLKRRHEPEPPATLRVLRLVRHRNTETLVGQLIDEVQRDLDLKKFTFVYEPRREDDSLRQHSRGFADEPPHPEPEAFREMVSVMKRHDPDTAVDLRTSPHLGSPFREQLQRAGLTYAVAFPVSRQRSGVLAWDESRSPEQVIGALRQHRASFKELMENAESFERVEELSYTDNLTGLANQRYFKRRLIEEIGRAKRYHRSLGLIMLDLDELKGINDSYGHQAGDQVIQHLGEILRNSIRSIDVTARYGGDEFCVIMPESDRVTCLRFMNRLKHKIAGASFPVDQAGKELTCTISQGGAVFPDNGVNSEQLIFAADMALLQSKEKGRNQYHLFES